MSSREDILKKVREGVGKGDSAARRQVAEAWMAARQSGPQPRIQGGLAERFRVKAEALASTVERVGKLSEVPATVACYLGGGGAHAVVAPDMAGLDWEAAGLKIAARGAEDADQVGITGCFCAIAETGTLMLLSGPDTPATVSLLPETHIAIVQVGRIVATMEEAFALLRAEKGSLPRAVNFISGPSRTGDIEQTIVLGAHGPCRVHLVLVDA